LRKELLDQRRFTNASLTTDKGDPPLTRDCLTKVCMEGSQFSISLE
jgi:hypothetical protein